MGDYFISLLRFASNIHHKFICFIEDLWFGYCERASQESEYMLSRSHGKCSHITNTSSLEDSSLLLGHSTGRSLHQNGPLFICQGLSVALNTSRFFCQGFMLPSQVIKRGSRLLSNFLKCFYNFVKYMMTKIRGFLSCLCITLQGSSNDIGWLQKCDGFPPVDDGTTHFMELLNNIRNGVHCLPNSLVYLLIPGLFSNLSPLYFVNTKKFFSKMGLACHIAKIHSEASVEKNAWELKLYVEELFWGASGKKVLLLGHSKGGVDAAAALSIYWLELKDKVAGLAFVQSPYGGSAIAADILREGQLADKEARRIMEFIICKVIKGDMRALEDLTYEKRKDFISKHRLPSDEIPMISFHTEARIAPDVLATMSHIAHAELPWLPLPRSILSADGIYSLEGGRRVPVVIPLAAAMAVSALHLKLRYGEASDGLVLRRDAEVPGSSVVRLSRKLDHSWMVYTTMKKNGSEADANEMCEALLTMLVEMMGRRQAGGAAEQHSGDHAC